MKKLLLGVALFLSCSVAYSAICDATYYFKSATLYSGRGNHVSNIEFTTTQIEGDLAIPTIKERPFDYRFPLQLTSQCPLLGEFPVEPSSATFAVRDSGEAAFTQTDEEDWWIRYISSQPFTGGPTAKNIMLMFLDTNANARDYVLEDSTDNVYKATYGGAIYFDSLWSDAGALAGLGQGRFSWGVKFDTSYFMSDLRASSLNSTPEENSGWNIPDYTATRDFIVQMLVVNYDTNETNVPENIQAQNQNRDVIIQSTSRGIEITLNESTLPFFPDVAVYNMRGKLIQQLSPRGSKFIWDGQGHSGPVSRGIYFIKVKNILHKVFYNPNS